MTDNYIEAAGAHALANMLIDNCFITEIVCDFLHCGTFLSVLIIAVYKGKSRLRKKLTDLRTFHHYNFIIMMTFPVPLIPSYVHAVHNDENRALSFFLSLPDITFFKSQIFLPEHRCFDY